METNVVQETILRVLGEVTGLQPQQSVSMADLSSRVQQELGVPEAEQSLFYVTISKVLGKLRKQGLCLNPRRGFWGLSADGILFCRGGDLPGVPEAVSTWTPDDDAYLISVATQEVPCLGWYRSTSKFCPKCYLAEACQQHMPQVRRQLLEEVLQEKIEVERKVEAISTDDSLLDLLAETETLPRKLQRMIKKGLPVQTTSVESFCAVCGGIIPANETVIWHSDRGNIHPKCWEE